MHVNILGKHIVILSSLKAAQDILVKRSANYSDRPRFVLLVELSVSSMVSRYRYLIRPVVESAGTCSCTCLTVTASGNTDVSFRKASMPMPSPVSALSRSKKLRISWMVCQNPPKRSRSTSEGELWQIEVVCHAFMINHTCRFAAGSILKLAYGHTVRSIEDIFVRTADRAASRTVEAGSPGSMIVDLFPIRTSSSRFKSTPI